MILNGWRGSCWKSSWFFAEDVYDPKIAGLSWEELGRGALQLSTHPANLATPRFIACAINAEGNLHA